MSLLLLFGDDGGGSSVPEVSSYDPVVENPVRAPYNVALIALACALAPLAIGDPVSIRGTQGGGYVGQPAVVQYQPLTGPVVVPVQPETITLDKWAPSYPDFHARIRVPEGFTIGPVEAPAALEVVTLDKWAPEYPDLVARQRTPEGFLIEPVEPPAAAPAAPDFFASFHPDFVLGARRTAELSQSVEPLYVPDVTVVAPLLSWAPSYPDRVPPAPRVVAPPSFFFHPVPIAGVEEAPTFRGEQGGGMVWGSRTTQYQALSGPVLVPAAPGASAIPVKAYYYAQEMSMAKLRQSTAVNLKFGPMVDETDGRTAETALTISQADVRLSKNGGAFAQKNDATTATHDENGYYLVPLNTTDVNTLGILKVAVNESGALPRIETYEVVTANVWDTLHASERLDVNVMEVSDDTTAADSLELAFDDTPGAVPQQGVSDQGTAQAATSTTVTLRAAAGFGDNTLAGSTIIVHGSTQGYWQAGIIASNVGSTDVCTLYNAFAVTPSGTLTYKIFASAAGASVVDANVVQISGDATAANNAESFFDGTGYAGTNNVIPTVTTVTNQVTANVTAISGDTVSADNLEAYTDGTTPMPVNVTQLSGDATAADNSEAFFDGTGYAGTGNTIPTVTNVTNMVTANVTQVSGDSVAADNAEAFFDGTGYAGTNNVIPTVTSVTSIGTGGITATSIATDAIGAAELAADAVDEILDEQIGDGTLTVRQALRLMAAVLGGKLSGAATTTVTIRNVADTTNVVVATVDADGNRTATTVTP